MEPKTVKIYQEHTKIHWRSSKKPLKDAGLRGKRKIFVKPNLSHPEYVPGVVTSPTLIREMVGLLRDGPRKLSSANPTGSTTHAKSAFEKTGVETAVKEAGGTVINLSEDKVVE